ncbi:hypothetical protein HFN58_00460 [Rhizobium leguminosarum]|nr:hypothetical protein [Rhizobium leguminosarum]
MTGAITTVPALLRDREPYRRPVKSRFTPSELDKTAVCLSWINADLIARMELEADYGGDTIRCAYADRHGYPTA